MNERILELAEQATVNIGNEHHPIDFFHQDKFAELIIRETMQVVANNLPQNTYLDVADAVIEHFKE